MEKLNPIKTEPKKIRVLFDKKGAWEEIGNIVWNGKEWGIDNDRLSLIKEDLLDNGMVYGDNLYKSTDRKIYLPLIHSNYISYAFEAVE